MRCPVPYKVYTGYHDSREIQHGASACTVDNPLAKVRGLSLRTGGQTMLSLSYSYKTKCTNRIKKSPDVIAHLSQLISYVGNEHIYWQLTNKGV